MHISDEIQGFRVERIRALEELKGEIIEMTHIKTGMPLIWLKRPDENKTFGIAFRTLPENSTGIFHILEHSVLGGSQKYPMKEPFLELLKCSLNTFLNAMTYPDKTVYPVASRSQKDFLNLVDVYLDAVLHPSIYDLPEIFRQEGWHYEIDEDGHASYKGVVFNEMKGAMADPDEILSQKIMEQIFPDNCYGYNSGGDPAHIPELSYEEFIANHRKYYHPSNARVFLDGDMEIEPVLERIARYLAPYTAQSVPPITPKQRPVKPAPVRGCYEVAPSRPTQGQSLLGMGFAVGEYDDRERILAAHALADVLCGSNEAPLTRRLLSAGLCEDVELQIQDGIYQPIGVLCLRNLDEANLDAINEAVTETLEALAANGLDHEQIYASLASMEFRARARDFGRAPTGLVLGLSTLDTWLYGGDPAANLQVGDVFEHLRKMCDEGGFEKLLRELLLENPHECRVLLSASHTAGQEQREAEAARLRAAEESWTKACRAELIDQMNRLHTWQQADNTPEELATLPRLSLEDLPKSPTKLPCEQRSYAGIPTLAHEIPTGGILYGRLYFDAKDQSPEALAETALLCALVGELGTKNRSVAEIQRDLRLYLGKFQMQVESVGALGVPERASIQICADFSALEHKLPDALALVTELLTGTSFADESRVKEQLLQMQTQLSQSFVGSGHTAAMTRAAAGFSAASAASEYSGGYAFYTWLKELTAHFDERFPTLRASLEERMAQLIGTARLTLSLTGDEESFAPAAQAIADALPQGTAAGALAIAPMGARREGIVAPTDVGYSAVAMALPRYDGSMAMGANALSYAYLWNEIRVQGGAYGTGFRANESSIAATYSFRDPSPARTLEKDALMGEFLRGFADSTEDLLGYIIGAVGDSDPLLNPSAMGKAADTAYFSGTSEEFRAQSRRELLATTKADLLALAQLLDAGAESAGVCVIGSAPQIEACGDKLDTVLQM
ncbi:MAG: insulinase family protein [Firmicutes bacterium]|nr:insulinase family protein [Bacillota bacterium]